MEYKGVTVVDLYSLVFSEDKEYKDYLKTVKNVFVEGWVRTNRDNGSVGL